VCGICCINGTYVQGREEVVRSCQEHDKEMFGERYRTRSVGGLFQKPVLPKQGSSTLCQIYMEELDSDFMIQEMGRESRE
jgi:hypothetical protein